LASSNASTIAIVWPTPTLVLAGSLYAASKSVGKYPLVGTLVASGWPELSTRTKEWQRASPGAALGQTFACSKRMDRPVFTLALSDAPGPVMAVGGSGLSDEHAANVASTAMLNNVRAWSNMMVFSGE